MTNAEFGEKALNEMYDFIMAGISAGTAALDGKVGTAVSVKMGGVDVLKGQLTHPEDNHYEAIGRFVGDSMGVIGSMILGGKMKNLTVQQKAIGAFGTSQAVAKIGFGDAFANLFNTYVANADAFYEKILTDANFASKTWSGIVENGLNNYVNYFDPDHDGSVSALDIVNGYKKLFSPPPAFGTAEFELQYNFNNKSLIKIKSPNEEASKEAVKEVTKHEKIKQITLNTQTYNVVSEDNKLLIRNAIDDIPKVSFLLSHIDIKGGDILDIGDQGLYTVKDGDTMSQIAEAHGMTTQALLKLNTWLIDEGRVSFDQDKVLVETDASNLTNKDHVLQGDANAKNILRDLNGGNDVLIGGNQSDYLEGGDGNDTYITGDGDTIMDSDHQGKVFLAGCLLQGGIAIKGETNKYEGDYGEIYTLDNINNTLHVKLEDEEITIKNYDLKKKSLGIALGKEITVTLDDAKVNEGDTMSIGVHIDTTLSQDITICIMTGEESASEGKDYVGFGENSKPYGEVTIKAGESVGYMKIPILKDTLTEENETFYIIPTPDPSLDTTRYPLGVKYNGDDLTLVTFANAGVGTILDGESKDVVITFHDVKVNEDTGKMTFSITSNTTLDKDLVIEVMSIDGSAKAGSDYISTKGQAIIQAGETAGTFSIDILNDDTQEEDETLILSPLSYSYCNTTNQNFIKNILTCKDFQSIKSLHVRMKIKHKGATYETQPKVA